MSRPALRPALLPLLVTVSLLAGAPCALAEPAAVPAIAAEPPQLIARDEKLDAVFRALGAALHKPVRLSNKARSYRVTGSFSLDQPFPTIERLSNEFGLLWYYDGAAIYVYDGSEIRSTVLSLPEDGVAALIAWLRQAALYDERFPIKAIGSGGAAYVSGPPKYIEVVTQAAASIGMDARAAASDTTSTVEIIKIRHAFVSNRHYARRDSSFDVPGIAAVLQQTFGDAAELHIVDPAVPLANNAHRELAPPPFLQPSTDGEREPRAPRNDSGGIGGGKRAALDLRDIIDQQPSTDAAFAAPAYWRGAATTVAAKPVRIVAYTETNSLLVRGTRAQLNAVRRLVETLDVPKEQVELSLWIVDIEKTDFDELGAKWAADAQLGPLGVSFNASLLNGPSTLSRAQTARFVATVAALATEKKAQIVSRPILLAQENSPAIFDSSRSFYVELVGDRSAALEKVTYGTSISVVPRVDAAAGRIEMTLKIEDGNQQSPDVSSGLRLPMVARTTIDTVARVLREQSLLVGGYTRSGSDSGLQKIPLLGDIPLLGNLFKFRTGRHDQMVRLFLIQPRLLPMDHVFDGAASMRPPAVIDNAVDALKKEIAHGRLAGRA